MRILVLGRNGQVAACLRDWAARIPGIDLVALGRPEFDLQEKAMVEDAVGHIRPDLIINAAAYTAVDKAESETDCAYAVNCHGAGLAAAAAARRRLPFIHLSTDYVFAGDKVEPYVESDPTGPLGAYGQSKLDGEHRVLDEHPSPLILRTSWVYSPFGANFVKTMLKLGSERSVLRVVSDQRGNPTSALDLASALLRIAPGLQLGGTYHLCGTDETTWYGFASEIFATGLIYGGPNPIVLPITTSQYPTLAQRPANSRLSTDAFTRRFGFGLGSWHSELHPVLTRLLLGSSPVNHRTEARMASLETGWSQTGIAAAGRLA